ncbi:MULTISPECIES: hypothetical protein [Gilvimarinus]|uniref:hypothetical protein n=1 Tax=Gilvimarinus TaxID=940550 RepID=UPI0003742E5E|nr:MULTISPECIES: hypothetical protein [Gilvimarinus]UTF61226.1 hypothetical protein NHM04_05345 [Gilvimarinus sp. DA14]
MILQFKTKVLQNGDFSRPDWHSHHVLKGNNFANDLQFKMAMRKLNDWRVPKAMNISKLPANVKVISKNSLMATVQIVVNS